MYRLCPLPSIAVTLFNHSGPCPDEKLATVMGISKRDDAKIGGITPAVFNFNGR